MNKYQKRQSGWKALFRLEDNKSIKDSEGAVTKDLDS